MNINSIRIKITLIFIILILIPLLLSGFIGLSYFQDALKQNILDDNLIHAKGLSVYVNNYIGSSRAYLESIASRHSLEQAIADNNIPYINETLEYAENGSNFYSLFITDNSGKVLSSYPNHGYIGQDDSNELYVRRVLTTSKSQVLGPLANRTGDSTIFISVPVAFPDGKMLGAMVGELDPDHIGDQILYTNEENRQFIYLVNGSGNVIIHTNRSYMYSRSDFSSIPAVQSVMNGREGVDEQYNPIENQWRLTAYSPVKSLGWGVIVAIPMSIAYRPIDHMVWVIAALTIALIVISFTLAYFFSNSIISPIMGLFEAARAVSDGSEYARFLPVSRKDELGLVAVCFDRMARNIKEDNEKIKDQMDRAELYVDIMGHDINNLNQVIMGNLELLMDSHNLTADQKRSILKALDSAKGSTSIINNVRKIQTIKEEKAALQPEDINDLIVECIREAPRPEGRNVTIKYVPQKGLIFEGTPLMKEVFCNLINNAIKHSTGDVNIDIDVVKAVRDGNPVYNISITDNGPGIPDSLKPRLYGRLQRGETKAHGKGLGLFIVKSLVDQAGGNIVVDDRVPGDYSKGARFIVSLPAYTEHK